MGRKLPSFPFYPGDWRKDPDLARCSHASKGVWIDLLCLMFECQERGVLATAGVPWTDHEIAGALGGSKEVVLEALTELVGKGVAKRRANGSLYSARLVRDEQLRQQEAEKKRRQRGCPGLVPALSRSCPPKEKEKEENSLGDSGGIMGGGRGPPDLADREILFWEAVRIAAPPDCPEWFARWAVNHARRFSLWRDNDPQTMADWWLLLKRIPRLTEAELEAASLSLLASDQEPAGRPQHPKRLARAVQSARRTEGARAGTEAASVPTAEERQRNREMLDRARKEQGL